MRTAGFIENPELPLLGIDSDADRNSEALCNVSIKVDDRQNQINAILKCLSNN